MKTYYIPVNFAEGGKIFNGMIEIRKLVEGAALAVLVWVPVAGSFGWEVGLFAGIAAGALGFVGYRNMPLSRFIVIFSQWINQRGIRLYNPHTQAYPVPVADMAMSSVSKKDAFMKKIANFFTSRIGSVENKAQVEGEDFQFGAEKADQLAKNVTVNNFFDDEDFESNYWDSSDF